MRLTNLSGGFLRHQSKSNSQMVRHEHVWESAEESSIEGRPEQKRRDIESVDLRNDQGTPRNSVKRLGKNAAKWFISSAQWRRRSRASCALVRLRPTVATTGASAR